MDTVRIPMRSEIIHLFACCAPGQIRGEPWLSRALVKLNELDQYDDAELVRKKTAAMFAGFVTRQNPEGQPDGRRRGRRRHRARRAGTRNAADSGTGRGHQFSDPADVGGSYSEFLRTSSARSPPPSASPTSN